MLDQIGAAQMHRDVPLVGRDQPMTARMAS